MDLPEPLPLARETQSEKGQMMRMLTESFKTDVFRMAAAGVAAVALYAFGATTALAETAKAGGTLVIAQDQGPDKIDPHGPVMALQHNLIVNGPYEALLTFDGDFKIAPSLAREWVEESPTSYLFTLREGVKFHDGSPLTMEDVLFTFERIMNKERPSDARVKMRMVKSVTAVGDWQVRFELSAPSPAFLRYIAAPEVTGIVNKAFTLANNGDLSTVANGTGPFKISSFKAGIGIKYERFADYWEKGLPYLDSIDLRIIPDDATRLAALRTGEIDMTFFRPDKQPLIKTLKGVVVSRPTPNAVEPLQMNCKVPPLDKLEVRQAIALSYDKTALMKTVLPGGLAQPGLVIPAADSIYGYKGDGTDLPYWQRDVEKAKALLAQAGFPDGITLKMMYINTPAFAINNRIAEFMKQQSAEAGITIELQPVEYATLLSSLSRQEFELMTSGRGMYPDPEGSLSDIVSSNPRTACVDPKVDEMMAAANSEPDMAKRADLLIGVQKYLLEQAYWYVFFNNPLRIEVWKDDVKGYEPRPLLRRTSLRSTWLDR